MVIDHWWWLFCHFFSGLAGLPSPFSMDAPARIWRLKSAPWGCRRNMQDIKLSSHIIHVHRYSQDCILRLHSNIFVSVTCFTKTADIANAKPKLIYHIYVYVMFALVFFFLLIIKNHSQHVFWSCMQPILITIAQTTSNMRPQREYRLLHVNVW